MEIKNSEDAVEFMKSLEGLSLAQQIKGIYVATQKDKTIKKLLYKTKEYFDFVNRQDVKTIVLTEEFTKILHNGTLEELEEFIQKIQKEKL